MTATIAEFIPAMSLSRLTLGAAVSGPAIGSYYGRWRTSDAGHFCWQTTAM